MSKQTLNVVSRIPRPQLQQQYVNRTSSTLEEGLKITIPSLWHWRAFLRHYTIDQTLGKGKNGCVRLASSRVPKQTVSNYMNLCGPVSKHHINDNSVFAITNTDDYENYDTNNNTNDYTIFCSSRDTTDRISAHLETVAVKSMLKQSDKANAKFLREICIHAHVTSVQEQLCREPPKWVVPLHSVIFGWKNQLAAVMPVCKGGTLEQELDWVRGNLCRDKRVKHALQRWAEGDRILQWLHERCMVIHGDAHAANWYIDGQNNRRLLLADFGESRVIQEVVNAKQFLLLASQERLLFRFETAVEREDKCRLGDKLSVLDNRLYNETDRNGKSLMYRSISQSDEDVNGHTHMQIKNSNEQSIGL